MISSRVIGSVSSSIDGNASTASSRPVQSSPNRERCASWGSFGASARISAAVRTPSASDTSRPSISFSSMRWKRISGSVVSATGRSRSPSA